jgi:hypothetical protein
MTGQARPSPHPLLSSCSSEAEPLEAALLPGTKRRRRRRRKRKRRKRRRRRKRARPPCPGRGVGCPEEGSGISAGCWSQLQTTRGQKRKKERRRARRLRGQERQGLGAERERSKPHT